MFEKLQLVVISLGKLKFTGHNAKRRLPPHPKGLTPLLSALGFFVRILHYLRDSISFRLRGQASLFLFGHFLMMLFKFKTAHPLRRNSDVLEVAPLFSHWSFFHDRFPLS